MATSDPQFQTLAHMKTEGLLKVQIAAHPNPTLLFLVQQVWGWARGFVFLSKFAGEVDAASGI